MIILSQREFSNKEQKRLRRAWEASIGKDEITAEDIDFYNKLRRMNKGTAQLKSGKDEVGGFAKNAETEAAISKARKMKKRRSILSSEKTLEDKSKMSPAELKRYRESSLDLFKLGKDIGEDEAIRMHSGSKKELPRVKISYHAKDKLAGGANPDAEFLGNIVGYNKEAEKINEDARKLLKDKEHKASIAKHEEQAKKLRSSNKTKVALRDAGRWVKKNPKTSTAIAATTLAAGAGLGYALKKRANKKKEEK